MSEAISTGTCMIRINSPQHIPVYMCTVMSKAKRTGKYIFAVNAVTCMLCIVFYLCQIAYYKCEPCNQTFPFPSKYRQWASSQIIHPSTSTPNANVEVELPDSETSEDMYRTATRDSDIENEAEDTTDLEDLFEEMNDKVGQSNGSYFPFPSKIFALLYLLVYSPHPMV